MTRVDVQRRRGAFVATMVMAAALLAAAPAAAEASANEAWPTIATKTVVRAQGNKGTTVVIPSGTSLRDYPFRLQLLDGAGFALALIARRDCDNHSDDALCASHRVMTFATPGWSDFFPNQTQMDSGFESELPPGPYDIYVVTDRAAELTLTFTGAPAGETVVEAAGTVDATVERLPSRCPLNAAGCTATGYGTVTHRVTHPGFAMVGGLAYRNGPGQHRLVTCIDPQFTTDAPGTPQPTLGCPMLPNEPASFGYTPQWAMDYLTFGSVWPGGGMNGEARFHNGPDGDVMAGYVGSAVGALEAGHLAWGVWLNGGIR